MNFSLSLFRSQSHFIYLVFVSSKRFTSSRMCNVHPPIFHRITLYGFRCAHNSMRLLFCVRTSNILQCYWSLQCPSMWTRQRIKLDFVQHEQSVSALVFSWFVCLSPLWSASMNVLHDSRVCARAIARGRKLYYFSNNKTVSTVHRTSNRFLFTNTVLLAIAQNTKTVAAAAAATASQPATHRRTEVFVWAAFFSVGRLSHDFVCVYSLGSLRPHETSKTIKMSNGQ